MLGARFVSQSQTPRARTPAPHDHKQMLGTVL
jgi:hypothetical protein